MSQSKVSVLIPSYNYARFLPQTIRSVQAQTMADFELLIVDDGSSDDSWNVIQAFAAEDDRIRAWRQPNAGLIATLNTLLARANNDYVAQIDADDLWLPTRLEMGMQDMTDDPHLSASFCGYTVIDGDGQFLSQSYHRHLGDCRGRRLIEHLVVRNCVCACTAFMRRKALIEAGGFARTFTLVHDWDRWLRLSLWGPLKLRAELGAAHRWHGANQSSDEATSRLQQAAIMKELAPRVLNFYQLDQGTVIEIVAQLHALSYGANAPGPAIEMLSRRSENRSLSDQEQVLLLLSLTASRQTAHAKALSDIMTKRMSLRAPEHQLIVQAVKAHLAAEKLYESLV